MTEESSCRVLKVFPHFINFYQVRQVCVCGQVGCHMIQGSKCPYQ